MNVREIELHNTCLNILNEELDEVVQLWAEAFTIRGLNIYGEIYFQVAFHSSTTYFTFWRIVGFCIFLLKREVKIPLLQFEMHAILCLHGY